MTKITLRNEIEVDETKHPFRKGPCFAYAFIGQGKSIQVCHGLTEWPAVDTVHSGLAFHSELDEDCSMEEFMQLYDEVMERINSSVLSISELQPS